MNDSARFRDELLGPGVRGPGIGARESKRNCEQLGTRFAGVRSEKFSGLRVWQRSMERW